MVKDKKLFIRDLSEVIRMRGQNMNPKSCVRIVDIDFNRAEHAAENVYNFLIEKGYINECYTD